MAIAPKPAHNAIDRWPKRLHEIVREAECVEAVVMVQADRRIQTSATELSRDTCSQYRVAVVEESVGRASVHRAAEGAVEEAQASVNSFAPIVVATMAATSAIAFLMVLSPS